jgi:hypothetical protein
MIKMKNICPVCGYDGLEELPYDHDGNPSYEICDCCGFEFGFDDDSEGLSFEEYRKKWIEEGAKWFNPDMKPKGWDIKRQLLNINVQL